MRKLRKGGDFTAFDQSFIAELKSRVHLSDVIGEVVQLKRAGSNLVGLCPFHSERTPSFTVFESSESYYCFGCGQGGDVITFVMRTENLEYPAAVELLARRAGMRVPEQISYGGKKIDRERMFKINADAARFFHETLMSDRGRAGLDYLTKKRGLPLGVIRHFGLGFAPDSWTALTEALEKKGYRDKELAELFLVNHKNGRTFDMFRNRVMFPIFDLSGHVIAFGGRVMDDSTPKYLNSSDTPVFKKRNQLYGLNFAKKSTRRGIIFCEGYMDVIALHRAGFTNAAATLGTAITPDQARLVRRFTDEAFLCYDSDEAGQRATHKAIELLEGAGVTVRVLQLPDAKDPDEFIKARGADAFESVIAASLDRIEYTFAKLRRGFDLNIPEQRLKFATAACEMLCGAYSPMEREVYLSRLSELTGIETGVLRAQLKSLLKRKNITDEKKSKEQELRKLAGYGDKVNPDRQKYPAAAAIEEQLLGLCVLHPEYLEQDAPQFLCAVHGRCYDAMRALWDETGEMELGALNERLAPEEISLLVSARYRREQLTNNSEIVYRELCRRLSDLRASALGAGEESGEDFSAQMERIRQRKQGGKEQK